MTKFILIFLILFSSLSADEKLVLQLKWLHQFQFAGYYAAYEKGFYKDVGLDVEIRERDLSKNNIKQVIDGEADYSVADSVLLLYQAKGEPIIIVAPIFQHSPNVLVTLKSSGLDSPYKLNNKDITFYKKDVDGFGILAMLKSLNVKANLSRIKEKTNHTYLAEKKTDAYVCYLSNEPFYFKQMGVDINILNPANYGFDLYGDMLFTSTKEVKNNPQRVEKFKEATIKGWIYALEHKEEIVKLIKKKYAKDKSIEHLRYEADALEQLIQHKAVPVGTLDKGRIEYTLNIYKKYGLITNAVQIEDYIFDPIKKQENKNSFTKEENQYLKNKKVIKMCIDPDWMPLEMNDKGKHIGMSSDYIALMEKYIATPIQMINTKTWSESLDYGKQRKCDIFSLIMPTQERRAYMDFTKPYLSFPLVVVTNLDELFISDITKVANKQIGIVKSYAFGKILRERYPHMLLVDVENVKDGLEKVKDGKLYGFIDALATTGYYIQKDYIGQLKIAGKFDETWDLGIGTRSDEPILKGIFDKAIDLVPLTQKQEILNKWISVNFDRGTNYTLVFSWVAGVSLVFSIILGTIIFVNRRLSAEIERRKEIEKRLEEISVTDDLTRLYNRRYFNNIFPKLINSAKRENENICLAILDVDYFKLYNDTYGHVGGDEVLKSLAVSMQKSMQRADDYCFRLGGEEFGVLFKGLSVEEAKVLIDGMRENIENLHIEHKKNPVSKYITASFGLVVKDANSIRLYDDLYKEADDLLYKAKEAGRNRVVVNV